MQGGDIDNSISPKVLVEFEDLIAHLPETVPQAPRRIISWPRQAGKQRLSQVNDWDLDDLVVKVMWHMVWNLGLQVEVITTQGPDFAELLANRLDREQVPAQRVWAYEPRALARRLVSMPYVAAIYTGKPEHAAMYGPARGRLVTPANVAQMGRF